MFFIIICLVTGPMADFTAPSMLTDAEDTL